jgi:hypothetical protein
MLVRFDGESIASTRAWADNSLFFPSSRLPERRCPAMTAEGTSPRRRCKARRPTGESISILIDAAHDEASRRTKITCAKKPISPAASIRFHLSSPAAKNIPLSFFPKSMPHTHIPRSKRGAFRDRHERWARDAVDASGLQRAIRERTNNTDADGQAAWSWHPDADVKVAVLD